MSINRRKFLAATTAGAAPALAFRQP
ncbi:twin-arginine translocation signal domain-containing protein [Escherichia coli]|nr:twin-arginine translocation signal domain-containing protein [Escherichia coli]